MSHYLKEDFEWDIGIFLSKINMINSNILSAVRKFSECIENKDRIEEQVDKDIIEDLGKVEIPGDLFETLLNLSNNLKNQFFFNAISTVIYSYFEFSLLEYCRLIDNYINAKKPFKNYSEKGLNKIKKYLKDNFEINFGDLSHWQDILRFKKIRNLIVHNGSNIITDFNKPITNQPYYHFISEMKNDIDITSTGIIFINNFKYINDILIKVNATIQDIINQTKEEIIKREIAENK